MEECVQLVQEKCEWANIANVNDAVLTGQSASCWCQNGDDLTPDDTSSYLNCWFGEGNDTDFSTTESDGVFYAQSIFEYFINSDIL